MSEQKPAQATTQPAPQEIPADLEFLNEPNVGSSPVGSTPPVGTSSGAPAAPAPAGTTSNVYGNNSGLPTGIIVSPAAADLNNTTPAFGVGTLDSHGADGGSGASSGQGIDELPNGDVIVVFEDQQPQAGDPMLNNVAFGGTLALVIATMLWPFAISRDSRLIDVLAIFTTVPACLAFLYIVKSPIQKQYVHPLNVWLKFFVGWCVMLPCAWFGAFFCLFVGIIGCALIIGLTGLKGWFAFMIFTVMMVVAITFPEEFVKLIGAQRDNVRKNIQNPRQYVLYSLFAALGMATFESYIMVHYIRRVLDYGAREEARKTDAHRHATIGRTHHAPIGHGHGGDHLITQTPGMTQAPATVRDAIHEMIAQAITHAPAAMASPTATAQGKATSAASSPDLVDGTDFIFLFIMCLVCIIPMHVLSGYHVGLGIARRDIMNHKKSIFGVIIIPVIFRSLFLYIIWFLPYITKWDEASLIALLLIPMYVVLVKREELKMPRSYLLRSGYMNAFGYGVLAEDDDANQGEAMDETPQQQGDDATTGEQRV